MVNVGPFLLLSHCAFAHPLQEAVDNDDGSGFYHTEHNVLVYGRYGQKADMAGHDNWHVGNLYAYVYPLCYADLGGGEVNNASHRDHHENNTCIQGQDSQTYASIRCEYMPDNRTVRSRTGQCFVAKTKMSSIVTSINYVAGRQYSTILCRKYNLQSIGKDESVWDVPRAVATSRK